MAKQVIVVLGMHRSGTSLLSGLVNLLGIDIASNIMYPQADNPLGFFEPQELVNLNNKFLRLLGYDWQTPLPIDSKWFLDPLRKDDVKQASDFLSREFAKSELFTIKDPRLCRILPIWQRAFQKNKITVKYLVIFRNPIAVSYSLSLRNDLENGHSILLWYLYNTDIIRFIKQKDLAFCLSYEGLINQPEKVIDGISKFIGVSQSSVSYDKIIPLIQKDLNHYPDLNIDAIIQNSEISNLVKNLYWDFLNLENQQLVNNDISSSSLEYYTQFNQNIEQVYHYLFSSYSSKSASLQEKKNYQNSSNLVNFSLIKRENQGLNIPEFRQEFDRKENFIDFFESNIRKKHDVLINSTLTLIKQEGFYCEFFAEQVTPEKINITSDNYRETITYRGFNSRLRAINHEVLRIVSPEKVNQVSIYAPEAITQFVLNYRGRFPKFLGSEYSQNPEIIKGLFPIPVLNLEQLELPTEGFDIVIVNDYFQHIPCLDKALCEISRVLKPGGYLLSTFPFYCSSSKSEIKARQKNGVIEYLVEPEYHGNPMDPKGSLVYEVSGWDILDRTKIAGFTKATMIWHFSPRLGILTNDTLGLFCLLAIK